MDRTKEIIKVSLVGIITNVTLAGFKAAVGLAAHSTAVLLDAVNDLSDVLSSVITVVGIKLAGKGADRELDALTWRIVPDVYAGTGILLTIGVYAANTSDEESLAINKAVTERVGRYPQIIQLHSRNSSRSTAFTLISTGIFRCDRRGVICDILFSTPCRNFVEIAENEKMTAKPLTKRGIRCIITFESSIGAADVSIKSAAPFLKIFRSLQEELS